MTPDMDGVFLLERVQDGDSVLGSIHIDVSQFDGWTMTAWRDDAFRLITLDTPERGEAGWPRAKADLVGWLRDEARGHLRVRTYGRDGFGRTLADVYDSHGATASEFMLRECGWLPWVAS